VLRLNGRDPTKKYESETPKQFFRRQISGPVKRPSQFPEKYYQNRHSTQGPVKWRRAPHMRNTELRHYPAALKGWPGYTVKFHGTTIVEFHRQGVIKTTTGGYYSKTTFDRIANFLPGGWNFFKYQHTTYWYNHGWPAEVRAKIGRIRELRRPPTEYDFFIRYCDGDWLDGGGWLHSNNDRIQVSPAAAYMNRAEIAVPDPDAPDPDAPPVQEGQWQKDMNWINSVRTKYAKMREIRSLQNKIEKIDKPDKRKKRLNLH